MNDSRRRSIMRRAADPCLGFYILPDAPTSTPLRTSVLEPPPDSSPSLFEDSPAVVHVVCVDEFLRQNALARAKPYRRRRQTRTPVVSIPVDAASLTSEEQSEDDAMTIPQRPDRKRCQPPLKKRLIRAALATKTDAEDWLPQDDSRHPLVLDTHQQTATKQRNWKLADPKKTIPPHSNSFMKPQDIFANSKSKQRTITGWQTRIRIDGSIRKKPKSKPKFTKATSNAAPVPLSFIPLAEAERSYSLMKRPRPGNLLSLPALAVLDRIHLDFPKRSVHRRNSPLPLDSELSSLLPDAPAVPTAPPLPVARSQSPSNGPLAPHPAIASPTTPINVAAGVLPVTTDNHSRPQPTTGLRPLGSFFQEFLETARTETQLSTENIKKATRRRPGPRRNGNNITLAPPPRPISTLKSFLQTSVRESQAPPTGLFIMSAAFHDHRQRSPENLHFRAPLIPAYRFGMPSTPPSQTSPQTAGEYSLLSNAYSSAASLFCLNRPLC
ncbi:hypothetical protein C8F01DRAFT_1119949, partial [Mycena amicta]